MTKCIDGDKTVSDRCVFISHESGCIELSSLPKGSLTAEYYARCYARRYERFLLSFSTLCEKIGGDRRSPERLHPHQARHNCAGAVRRIISDNLLKDADFQREFHDFEELYELVDSRIRHIDGIGDLAVYDISLRIGFDMTPPVRPERYVYLSCGAALGAKMLTGSRLPGRRVEIEILLPFVAPLTESWQIENYLCLYHINHANTRI